MEMFGGAAKAFSSMADKDGDGKIDRAHNSMYDVDMSRLKAMDKDGDGKVGIDEFDAASKPMVQEKVHYKTVISKFGGTIKLGMASSIPDQTAGGLRREAFVKTLEPCDGKGTDDNVFRTRAGGWIVGYSGHRPKAREVTHTMAYGGVPLFHRLDGSRRIPGQGAQLGNRDTTAWQEIAPTMKSAVAAQEVGGVGVPGYMGHVPHGTALSMTKRADAVGPWGPRSVKTGWSAVQPNKRPASSSTAAKTPGPGYVRPHATDYKALDRTGLPDRMPVVGYAGHLRKTRDSTECFGTSHWRPNMPPSRAAQAAMSYDMAKQKAIDSFKPAYGGNTDTFAGLVQEHGGKNENPLWA